MHFFASPYLMAYNTFGKINENLEDVGSDNGNQQMGDYKGCAASAVYRDDPGDDELFLRQLHDDDFSGLFPGKCL